MELKKGDIVDVTLTKAWADSISPVSALHYFDGNVTETSRLFIAKVVSTSIHGLWVESLEEFIPEDEKADPTSLLVPWPYILAIGTSPSYKRPLSRPGFISN